MNTTNTSGLKGRRVLVTRAPHQAAGLVNLLKTHEAIAIERPTITVEIRHDAKTLAELSELGPATCDLIVVTSSNAATALVQHAQKAGPVRVFAIGDATGDVLEAGGFVELDVSPVATAEGVLEHVQQFYKERLPKLRVVLPQASAARPTLREGLLKAGVRLSVIDAYDVNPVKQAIAPLPEIQLDWVTFTAPSSVQGFVNAYGVRNDARIACMGPTTRDAADKAGFTIAVAPGQPSLEALVQAMEASPF
jgi:uroporphyrinogen-III synthase